MAEPRKQPARLARTWVVAVFALIGGGGQLCIAGMGAVGLAMQPMQRQAIAAMPAGPMRDAQAAVLGDEVLALQVAGLAFAMAASAILIAAGVGLILRRGWGRALGLLGGGLTLFYVAINMVVTLQSLGPMEEAMMTDPNVPPGAVRAGMYVGAACMGGCMGGIPLVCMILLMTPAVAAEIRAWDSWRRAEDAF